MTSISNLSQIYIDDDITEILSKYLNVPVKNIQYTNLQSILRDDPINPINSDYLFFLPMGVISSSDTSSGLTINPIKRNISEIIPSEYYVEYSTLFKKLYILNLPDFSTSYEFVSNPITFNNSTDKLVFSFLCYVSEDQNIDSIEQSIVNNSNSLLSGDYIIKKLTPEEFGVYSLVGITISPNGNSSGKLKIKINRKPNTGNKTFGRIIISEPVLFQYQGTTLIPPLFNNLYMYSLPMFNLQESLQLQNYNNKFTIMFVFTPMGSQIPSTSESDYLKYYLFSFGQKNPSNNLELGLPFTQRQFINQFLSINSNISSKGDFNNIDENKNITLSVQTQRYDGELQTYQQTLNNINIKNFLYLPHLQIITFDNYSKKMNVYIYLNFKTMLKVENIPIETIDFYQQKFVFNSNVDFVLGGILNNKTNPRDYVTTVANNSNFIFTDLIVIKDYLFNISNFEFDKVLFNKTFKSLFYKIMVD